MTRTNWPLIVGLSIMALVWANILSSCTSAPPIPAGPQDLRSLGGNPSALRANRCEGKYPPEWCPK